MSDITTTLVKYTGILFALLLLAFTGYQTWSLLYEVAGNPLVASLGLIVFEVGMLYWWFFFQSSAQGLGQMALSIGMFLVGLILVCGATALHLGAVGADTLGPDTPAKLITGAVIVNVVAKFFMPLLHPETLLSVKSKAQEGKILDKSFKLLESKADDMSQDLADTISNDMLAELRQKVLSTRKRPLILDGQASHVIRPALSKNGLPAKVEQTAPAGPVESKNARLPDYDTYLALHDLVERTAEQDGLTPDQVLSRIHTERVERSAAADSARPTPPGRNE